MTTKPAYLSKDYVRLWDLVRYMRSELADADLITMEEYNALVCDEKSRPGTGSPSPQRLSSYDETSNSLTDAKAALARLQQEREGLIARISELSEEVYDAENNPNHVIKPGWPTPPTEAQR